MRTRHTRSAVGLLAVAVAIATPLAHPAVRTPNSQKLVPATTSVYTGLLIYSFTITIKPTIPTSYPITCTVDATPVDDSFLYTSESKTVTAVRSGNTATCTFSINYAWNLSSSSDMINSSYTVQADGDSTSLIERTSSGQLPSVALPPNGGSVSQSIAVTL